MSQKESEKDCLHFLNTVFDKGLYSYNKEFFDKDFFENFHLTIFACRDSFADLEEIETLSFSTKEKMEIFKIICFVNIINMHLEVVKKYLKMLIKKGDDGIDFDENTTLGQIIKRICNKISYPQKLKDTTFDLFCVDFRNAIAHQHYLVSDKGITIYPKDENKKKIYETNDLLGLGYCVAGLYDAITKFGDNKAQEKIVELRKVRKRLVELNEQTEVEKLDEDLAYFKKTYPHLDWES